MKDTDITISLDHFQINGILSIPDKPIGLVVFAHGSGSSRFSKRNQFVAGFLNQSNISTFLFDLLTPEEDKVDQYTREFRFNIPLLAQRLIVVTNWIRSNQDKKNLNIGYFGSSTGAAAALIAAAQLPNDIKAVVSRGGRVDLAAEYLENIQSPTLFIVGELDYEVITLNERAFERLSCTKELTIISGATHLFEEPGTLEQVAQHASDWFAKFLI